MATHEELKKIAIKSIEDDAFRVQFEKDPVAAASSVGVTLTDDQAQAIKAQAEKAEKAGLRESKSFVSSIFTSF